MRVVVVVVLVALTALTATGCGTPGPVAPSSPDTSASSAHTEPTAVVAQPPVEDDYAALEPAMLGAHDLGVGWRLDGQVQDLNPTRAPRDHSKPSTGEFCTGRLSELFAALLPSDAGFVETFKHEGGSASVEVRTIPQADPDSLRAAVLHDVQACRSTVDTAQDGTVSYGEATLAGPGSADGGDLVVGWTFRSFRDKAHAELSSSTQGVLGRTGRAVTLVAYYPSEFGKNARGTDFRTPAMIATRQLHRLAPAFPS